MSPGSSVGPLVRAPRLRPGAKVAVVAPSGPVPADRLEAGLDILRGWGLDPVVAPHVLDLHAELDYLAGSDEARARDLQDAWCDPTVSAVLCARGGYGAQRMADLLDWDAVRAAPPRPSSATATSPCCTRRSPYARESPPCTVRWSPP